VPRISAFYGIVIWMYHDDHNPPHFHASYGEHWAVYRIDGPALLAGSLPARARRMVEEWVSQHSAELLVNWQRARADEPLLPIDPLP
jgi:uncharacterized protein DUF4160